MPEAIIRAAASIPAYALYGEADAGTVPAGVHAETIRARSSPLGWRIAPHRHGGLYQAIWIASGRARASIEGVNVDLPAGSLAFVPPLIVHGYAFSPDTAGIVVSMPAPVLAQGLFGAASELRALSRPILLPSADAQHRPAYAEACFLFETILRDHGEFAPGRDAGLTARAGLLALWFARRSPPPDEDDGRTAARPDFTAVKRFLGEVEASYQHLRPLRDYARAVGVSVPHLGRVCRNVTGRSPLALIHDRRLIEAKRLLVYTGSPIGEIAARLGFDSAAYFSRFFRQRMGRSPQAFRREAEGKGKGEDRTLDA